MTTACWEQVSREWFSQMKEQPAVQAMENVPPLLPPEGTIPFGGIEPRIKVTIEQPVPAMTPEAEALVNPVAATGDSVQRGKQLYTINCGVCHGPDGMANLALVPVALAMTQGGMLPLPLVRVPTLSDGFLFTKIRYGKPGMPGYPQISATDRWHIVNYLRTLMGPPS
jgi:mono/diheme cytochrome c family protein